eukprot:CAMPEP_0180061012 /NCGR_PEP_ID=MMETSP0985-20121206/6362_1 /TAXON_ID=483367 /ORGANISM="non described non described, Strain CCMP 2436" /LENGTH=229 /DNA_ID=CAMNT_0021991101 /DNA_START=266 /DNA_END=953 /DNA_ORIENTATION=+
MTTSARLIVRAARGRVEEPCVCGRARVSSAPATLTAHVGSQPLVVGARGPVEELRGAAEDGHLDRRVGRGHDSAERGVKVKAEHQRTVNAHQLIARLDVGGGRGGGTRVDERLDDDALAVLILHKLDSHRLGERDYAVVGGIGGFNERPDWRLLAHVLVDAEPAVYWRNPVLVLWGQRLERVFYAVEETVRDMRARGDARGAQPGRSREPEEDWDQHREQHRVALESEE